ncbi:hypothetical protein Tco_0530578 [Tanacetum coccineum]
MTANNHKMQARVKSYYCEIKTIESPLVMDTTTDLPWAGKVFSFWDSLMASLQSYSPKFGIVTFKGTTASMGLRCVKLHSFQQGISPKVTAAAPENLYAGILGFAYVHNRIFRIYMITRSTVSVFEPTFRDILQICTHKVELSSGTIFPPNPPKGTKKDSKEEKS